MNELIRVENNFALSSSFSNSGIDFDALAPGDLAEFMRLARMRGMRPEDSPEVQATMARFLNDFDKTKSRYSKNTLRRLACAWGQFARWCRERDLVSAPASVETVNSYLLYRAETAHRNSVASDRWAIGRMHRAAGCPDPSTDDRVSDMLAAIVRQKVEGEETIEQASPMREYHLDQVMGRWRGSSLVIERRDLALLTVAYESMLRAAELARVKMKHVSIQPDGSGVLVIPITKTNHSGEPDVVALSRQAISLCMEYLELAGRTFDPRSEAALFGSVSRHGSGLKRGVPLTTKTIERIFARAHEAIGLVKLGIPVWSGHSARVGAAQDLAADGFNALQIMQAGRWASERMVIRYCHAIFAKEGVMAGRRSGRV